MRLQGTSQTSPDFMRLQGTSQTSPDFMTEVSAVSPLYVMNLDIQLYDIITSFPLAHGLMVAL
jgi:hypothetical protein